jgi:peptidoglycan/LPS O-acetylase OafA/YrhL
MPLISNFRYRPEIDGLRAIAVMAVVLFHAGLGVTGGFIGVDVFFVISGFLITSLIFKDLEAGKFSFTNFWERRARRIIPASVAMVFAVLIAGWFLLLPSDYAALGKSAAMHAAFAANFYFWRSTNYFSGPADELPLLHTWSLAVEEQFYLFVPLLLAGLFRLPKLRSRRVLLLLFGIGFVISLALSIIAVPRMPAAAFYLLPTRAWELLAGSIIAILPTVSLSRPLRELLCWTGFALILIPCFLYTKQTPFPGLAALPPCLGTALFIWVSGSTASEIQNSKFKISWPLAHSSSSASSPTRFTSGTGRSSHSAPIGRWNRCRSAIASPSSPPASCSPFFRGASSKLHSAPGAWERPAQPSSLGPVAGWWFPPPAHSS